MVEYPINCRKMHLILNTINVLEKLSFVKNILLVDFKNICTSLCTGAGCLALGGF
jgi:hypothetical protein